MSSTESQIAFHSPQPFYFQRSLEEEDSLPPRSEKPKPSKKAAMDVSSFLRAVFPAAFKPASTVPGLSAKHAEIREYLARLLADKRGLQEDEASRVVAGWKIGSGQELRQYGAAMYLDIFGREHGWVLYREVKLSVRRERRLLTRYPLHTVTIGAIAVMVSTIVLLAMLDMGEGITIFLILAAFFSTLTCFVCIFLQCWGTSESKMIERELKAATKTETRPHLE